MGAPVRLRDDFDGKSLRRLARGSRDAGQTRRLLSLAAIYDGGSRGDAARIGGVGLQTVRDWVIRFNEEGPDGLIDRKAPGGRPKLDEAMLTALAERVDAGPDPSVDGVVRWRLKDLAQWLHEEFGVSLDETNVGRALKSMDFVRLTARPQHHAQDEAEMEAFKKTSPPSWRRCEAVSKRA